MSAKTKRSDLHQLADELDDDLVETAFLYLHQLVEHGGDPGLIERSTKDTASQDRSKPLWGIAGIGQSNLQSDVAKHKDDYLAKAYETEQRHR